MRLLAYWTVRLALLAGAFGVWWSFQKGDGPAPDWGPLEQVAQSLGAACLLGCLGAALGLPLDLIAWMVRKRKS